MLSSTSWTPAYPSKFSARVVADRSRAGMRLAVAPAGSLAAGCRRTTRRPAGRASTTRRTHLSRVTSQCARSAARSVNRTVVVCPGARCTRWNAAQLLDRTLVPRVPLVGVELHHLVAGAPSGVGHVDADLHRAVGRHRRGARARLGVPERGVGQPVPERVQRLAAEVQVRLLGRDDVVVEQVGGRSASLAYQVWVSRPAGLRRRTARRRRRARSPSRRAWSTGSPARAAASQLIVSGSCSRSTTTVRGLAACTASTSASWPAPSAVLVAVLVLPAVDERVAADHDDRRVGRRMRRRPRRRRRR